RQRASLARLPPRASRKAANSPDSSSQEFDAFEFEAQVPGNRASCAAPGDSIPLFGVEHGLALVVNGFAQSRVEVQQLLARIAGGRAVESDFPAVAEIPTVEGDGIGHHLGQFFPAVEREKCQVASVFENNETGLG